MLKENGRLSASPIPSLSKAVSTKEEAWEMRRIGIRETDTYGATGGGASGGG